MRLWFDQGHCTNENQGASANGITEQDVTYYLGVACRAAYLAFDPRSLVFLSRVKREDSFPLNKRWEMANNAKADIFVSIHCNASTQNPNATGYNIFYGKGSSRGLELSTSISAGLREVGIKPFGQDVMDDSKTNLGFIGVLHHTIMPACLIEADFLTNVDAAKKLVSHEFQQLFASGVLEGIKRYKV